MKSWTDEYHQMVDDCEERESFLSDWERGFIDSVRYWIESGKLTATQAATIEKIWEKATENG